MMLHRLAYHADHCGLAPKEVLNTIKLHLESANAEYSVA